MKTVKIAGKDYRLKFGLNSARMYCREKGIEFDEYDEYFQQLFDPENKIDYIIDDVENVALLVLSGIRNGMRKETDQVDLDIEDVIDWFGEEPGNMAKALTAYAESKPTTKKDQDQDGKK